MLLYTKWVHIAAGSSAYMMRYEFSVKVIKIGLWSLAKLHLSIKLCITKCRPCKTLNLTAFSRVILSNDGKLIS